MRLPLMERHPRTFGRLACLAREPSCSIARPRPFTAAMSNRRFKSITLFRRGGSLPLVMGLVVVTKEIEENVKNQHPDEPDQCDQHPPNKDPLSHRCVYLHRLI